MIDDADDDDLDEPQLGDDREGLCVYPSCSVRTTTLFCPLHRTLARLDEPDEQTPEAA